MIFFTTPILKFGQMGEKTGWTYIEIPAALAFQIHPDNKKAFRVKGYLDDVAIEGISLVPMGEGNFIMAINSILRKKIKKQKGATIAVKLEKDKALFQIPDYFTECLKDEPNALTFFNTLTDGNKRYFVNWIESAKTEETKTKRLAMVINALASEMSFGQMIRNAKNNKIDS